MVSFLSGSGFLPTSGIFSTARRLSCRDLSTHNSASQHTIDDDIDATGADFAARVGIAIGGAADRATGIAGVIDPHQAQIDAANNRAETDINSISQIDISSIASTFTESPFLALGRNALIMNRQDYLTSLTNLSTDYKIEDSLIEDKIKYYNGSFYVLDQNNSLIHEKFTHFPQSFFSLSSFVPEMSIPDNQMVQFGSINFVYLNGSPINSLIDPDKIFKDFTFSMQMPFENSELLNNLNLVGTSIVDLKENYNFYIKEYEKIATNTNSNSTENTLPNLYVLNTISEDSPDENIVFLNSLSPSNSTLPFNLNQLFDVKDQEEEYFNEFSLNYNNISNENKNFINIKNQNIIFLLDTTSKLEEISKRKYSFPMFMEFSVPTDKKTNVSKMLIDSELMDNFMIKLFDLYKSGSFETISTAISENIYDQQINQDQTTTVENSFSSKIKDSKFTNIDSLLENLIDRPISLNDPNSIIIGDTKKHLRTNSNMTRFVDNLKSIIFKGKLNTFSLQKKRTYLDILRGNTCYNETLAFRVSKYIPNTTNPIQNYWIPNNPNLDALKLIDTQVKYEKEYIYKIFAYQFVLGNEISHVDIENDQQNNKVDVVTYNTLQKNLVEVEIFSSNKTIKDTPPLSPEIEFVPYQGVDNKIGLFINSKSGEEKVEIINILPTDDNITSKYKTNLNNTVLYKSDDVPKRFEIMKLQEKPKSYADFSKGFIKSITTDLDGAQESTNAAAFIDSIEPNKKYYYCFRTVDVHEKISNPTSVFEFEMVNEKGMIFPIIKNYEFEKPKYINNLEIRRFIKIKPASQHAFLNRELSNIDNFETAEDSLSRIALGLSEVGIPWGKTFKLVATSKQTGKKCEIKFKFNYRAE